MSYNPIETGMRIRQFRESLGISRACFAESLHISLSHLQKVELGANSASIDLLVDISELYEISIDYLLKGTYENAAPRLKVALKDIIQRMNSIVDEL